MMFQKKKKKSPIIQLSYKKLEYFGLILNDNATSRTVFAGQKHVKIMMPRSPISV